MRIPPYPANATDLAREREDLLRLAQAPPAAAQRPCARCDAVCGCARRSTRCACRCTPECPDAPRELSAAGDAHPIERGVLPVVFGLATLRVVPPCWSCEGHLEDAAHARAPQVWFHAASVVHASLVGAHLAELAAEGRLAHRWQVAICDHQGSAGATVFVLAPVLAGEMHLGRLHVDLREIGRTLVDGVRRLAQRRLGGIEHELARARR